MKRFLLICLLMISMMTIVACGANENAANNNSTAETASNHNMSNENHDSMESDTEMSDDEEMSTGDVYAVDIEASSLEWSGSKVGSTHNGPVDIQSGSLEVDGDQLVAGEFVIDMTSIDNSDLSGGMKDKLVGHLKSDDFFGVETYPTASLVIKSADRLNSGDYAVVADLTIKETTAEVTFNATVEQSDTEITANADITIDRAVYDVRFGSGSFFDDLGDDLIDDEVDITIALVATK